VWLDLPVVDWEEVRGLLTEAYRVTASKGLAAKLEDAPGRAGPAPEHRGRRHRQR
jgi:hypothetical protein